MKSKKRHHTSSEESEDSEGSARSSSTSESESDDSSVSEHRHKKKRKRANSSESESDSDGQKRSKRRKHKKKKKKHGKKKRRSDSVQSVSVEEISISEGELSPKKKRKHKHKHSKRDRSSEISESEEGDHVERRLHSVVKERRASSEEGSRRSRNYYQRDYRRSESVEEQGYDREQEVQRFYKGSSKERSLQRYNDNYYERERNDKYASYPDKYYKPKFGQNVPYNSNEQFSRRQSEYDDYRRHQRYEDRRPQEEYHSRPREEHYQPREESRGYNQFNKYNQYEAGPKRRDYEEGRDYRERRPPEPGQFKGREYIEKRYQEPLATERVREVRRDRPAAPRHDKPAPPPPPAPHRETSRSRSPGDRYREQSTKRAEPREERNERYKDERRPHREEPRRDMREDRDRDNKRVEERRDDRRIERREDKKDERREDKKDDREDRRDERRDGREERRDERRDGRGDERRSRPPRSEERKQDRALDKAESKPRERKSRFGPDDNKEYSWGKTEVKKEDGAQGDKEKPNFGLSGKLTEDANTVNGVVIKYTQPDDAKQPKRRWRFYPFKGDKALPILYIHRQSAFLIGRDKKVVDIILEHPSVSKQHAALQYRATPFTRHDGSTGRRVRPYIIDLDSANGTFVNNKKIEPRRYVELLERDVVKFGFSQREYVLLHENSKDDAQDDDNQDTPGIGAGITTTDKIKQEKRAKEEMAEDGE